MKQIEKYKKIINEIGNEIFGEGYIVPEHNNNEERLHIRLILENNEYTPYTFIIEDGKYILTDGWSDKIELKLTSLEVFKQYATQVLLNKCKSYVIKLYKEGIIETLPPKFNISKPLVYLNKLTVGWFSEKFNESTGGDEKIENVKITKVDTEVVITFDVDCKRLGLHRDNQITINNRGGISYNVQEIMEYILDYENFENEIISYISVK